MRETRGPGSKPFAPAGPCPTAGLLEDAVVLVGQAGAALAGDLGQDLVEPRVELFLGEDGGRGGLRDAGGPRLARPGRPGRGPRGGALPRFGGDHAEPR